MKTSHFAFRVANSARGSILVASMALAIALGALIVPAAQAQNTITLFIDTNYVRSSFGRQLSFRMEPTYAPGNGLSGATLVVNLPPGVSFVSADPSTFDQVTVTSVTGSSATGEQVTLAIGLVNSNFLVFSDILTVSIDNTVADGTMLQATFDLSGTLTTTGAMADSGPVPVSFQAGYVPVSVFVAGFGATCNGQVRNADFTFSSFRNSSSTGLPASGSLTSLLNGGAIGGLAAIANGASDSLSPLGSLPFKLGDITGPNSQVRLRGIGGSALAYGGFALFPNLPTGFTAFNLPASADCGDSLRLSFSNPNPYGVPLIFDERANVFLAAGNGAADPIGFPSSASTGLTVGNGNVTDIGSGVATSTIFERELDTPSGNTLEVAFSITCFPEGQSACDFTPPSDTTQSTRSCGLFFSGSGCDLVPPGVSSAATLEFPATSVDAQGSSSIETDATTGSVILVRSGYGAGSGAVSLRFLRGDANLPAVQHSEPAKLVVSGSPSPIVLMVTDAQGHRAGFQSAPSPPPQFLDAQPSVLTEIFGASYSGIGSQPQMISIPDPDPGPGDFSANVTGTGTGSFTLTMETLAIDGTMIDSKSFPGTASPGSTTNVNFTVQEDGSIAVLTPSCATDMSSSVAITRSGFGFNFTTGRFYQKVTLTNSGSSPIADPLSLVLDNLSSNATLFNATGTTACAAPLHSPFINLSGPLSPGASASVVLQFTDPTKAAITYATRVLAGSGSR